MERDAFPWQNPLRQSANLTLTVLSLAILTACGGGGSGSTPTTLAPAPTPAPTPAPAPSTQVRFTNVTEDVGLDYLGAGRNEFPRSEQQAMSGGIAVADVNDDGHLDVFITHGYALFGKLFTFDGDTYTESSNAVTASVPQGASLFIDLDRDGALDLLTMQTLGKGISAYLNQGDGQFVSSALAHGLNTDKPTFSAAAADYDLDGDLDLYFTHWGGAWTDESRVAYLYRQDNTGEFSDWSDTVEIIPASAPFTAEDGAQSSQFQELSFTPVFTDINQDGYPDLLVSGDFSSSQVLINDGGTGFIDATTHVISDENGMGNAVSDFDRDGDMDWFVSSIWNPIEAKPYRGGETGNRLYSNDGQGTFVDVTDAAGVREGYWGWGSCAADFNLDGHQDLFMTNGMSPTALSPDSENNVFAAFEDDPSRLYMANGQGAFVESSSDAGLDHSGQGRGVVCFDYDRDGDIDVMIANNGQAPTLYRNDSETNNHYISIKLHGEAANPEAIGARVLVTAGDTQWVREIYAGNNYLSQEPAEAHIGLGTVKNISEVRVVWPGSGHADTVLTDVEVDQLLQVSLTD